MKDQTMTTNVLHLPAEIRRLAKEYPNRITTEYRTKHIFVRVDGHIACTLGLGGKFAGNTTTARHTLMRLKRALKSEAKS